MLCNRFKFNEITAESLRQLTEVYAGQIYNDTRNADSLHNWIEGKKLVAFSIVDSYVQNCMTTSQCLPLPDCCREYLKELSIQDVKKFKAYFIWESRGGKKEPGSFDLSDYDAAGNELLSGCDLASEKTTSCIYLSDILFAIEKRRNVDRRVMNYSTSQGTIRNARRNGDRRKNGPMSIIDEFLRNNLRHASQRITA